MLKRESPQRHPMTYQAYLEFAPETRLAEWANNEVFTYRPPIEHHQTLTSFLGDLINLYAQSLHLGKRIYPPFEVKLWPDGPSREPDIIFITTPNLAILTPKRVEGAPDLLVEIISPSSVTIDRVDKFKEYEQAGVKEYWLIDPRPRQQQVDFYVLGDDNRYHPAPIHERGIYTSSVLSGFWFKPTWLWQDPLPDPQLALAEIMVSVTSLPPEVIMAYQTIQRWLKIKDCFHDKNF